ncbi:right-handed parallel beta-helix repeat-containing protein [bacterium]|nr:right-handed parallel beta-helix repeat-containing protein [bacterium]
MFFIFAQASYATLIDGYCYYEGGSDYSGSKVKFLEITPSAVTDSTETLSSGYFSIDIVPGIYDVVYSRTGYLHEQIENLILIADTTMPPVTLLFGEALSGALSGTIGPGGFIIFDDISVEFRDTLRLVPGTVFRFAGDYLFEIEGTLLAQGTSEDSIFFTTLSLLNPDYWENIRFSGAGSSNSRLTHCDIQYGSHVNLAGGGVQCVHASPVIANCTFRDNIAGYGGAIGIEWDSSPTISHCMFFGNSANYGGAIFCGDGASPTISNCVIYDNSADFGGGIYCGENSSPIITRCTISDDSASFGGGVSCRHASPVINSTIIAFAKGAGLYFHQDCSGSQIEYCDIFGNTSGEISYYNQDPSQGPPGIGTISTTNANGDPCDEYFNIFLTPLFVDAVENNYHLEVGSPCIDAGDPSLSLDPDTTVADMGAFYFDQLDVDAMAPSLPASYFLAQNYPNPFNPTTTIRYDLKQTADVSVKVFNLLGQEIATLVQGRIPAGTHDVVWDATDLPSGIYFFQMAAGDFVQTRKMVLLK